MRTKLFRFGSGNWLGALVVGAAQQIAQRDVGGCLALVEQLLKQGESAIGILLVAIAPTIRNLLLVKDLMQRHRLSRPQAPWQFNNELKRLPERALDHLPRKKDGTLNAYPLGIAAANAHRYKLNELRALLGECLQANVQLVTSSLDEKVVLSELIARGSSALRMGTVQRKELSKISTPT